MHIRTRVFSVLKNGGGGRWGGSSQSRTGCSQWGTLNCNKSDATVDFSGYGILSCDSIQASKWSQWKSFPYENTQFSFSDDFNCRKEGDRICSSALWSYGTCLSKGQLKFKMRIDQRKQVGLYRADRSAVGFDWLYKAKTELRTPSS